MISSHGRWWGACPPRLEWAFRVPIGYWRLPNWVLGSAHGLRASAWALGASRSPWDRVLRPAVGISVRSWPGLWVAYSEAPLRRSGCMWRHMPSSVRGLGVLYGPWCRCAGSRFCTNKKLHILTFCDCFTGSSENECFFSSFEFPQNNLLTNST